MDEVELSIIIINYNTAPLVLECVKSLRKHLNSFQYEIIIVDNSQKPESRIKNQELSKILAPTAYSLLQPTTNKGFGSANNLGAKKASGKYLLLLNPDTVVIDNSIKKMLDFMKKHTEIGASTCLLYNDLKMTRMQKNFFGKFQSLASVTFRHYNYQKVDCKKEFFYTDIVTGAVLMIKKEVFEKIGGFDERFFMYLEDDDLCKRLVDNGYKNLVLNTAKVIHLEGKSVKNNSLRKKMYYESQNLYWQKHNGFIPTLLMKFLRWPYKLIKTRTSKN